MAVLQGQPAYPPDPPPGWASTRKQSYTLTHTISWLVLSIYCGHVCLLIYLQTFYIPLN